MMYSRLMLLVGASALLGCQGQLTAADDGGSADGALDGGGDDGSVADVAPGDAGRFACPSSSPEAGTACVPLGACDGGSCMAFGEVCEYGDDPSVACNTLFSCQQDGTWAPLSAGFADAACPSPPNDAKCAADFASVPRGQTCALACPSLCSYPEGFCGCANLGITADGGTMREWSCESPHQGCPVPRPKLGSPAPCSIGDGGDWLDRECDYWGCGLKVGVRMYCGSVWLDLGNSGPPLPPNCP